MNLMIKNSENLDLDKFCNWLITCMQNYMRTAIDDRKLKTHDLFLNQDGKINFVVKQPFILSAKNILIASTYNLIVNKIQNQYVIEIDPNINIPNTYAKFIDIVKLINYGNLNLSAYAIYTKMMNYFAENLQEYYNQFIEGGNI